MPGRYAALANLLVSSQGGSQMKDCEQNIRWLIGIALLVTGASAWAASSVSAQTDEVWAMEERYWEYVEAGDVENYVMLWHDDFVGWPCNTVHPSRKDHIGDWVQEIRDEGIQVSYDLHREATEYFGDIGVAHYSTPIIYRYPDGRVTGENQLLKFTHTWVTSDSGWQIITGMCALAEPVG